MFFIRYPFSMIHTHNIITLECCASCTYRLWNGINSSTTECVCLVVWDGVVCLVVWDGVVCLVVWDGVVCLVVWDGVVCLVVWDGVVCLVVWMEFYHQLVFIVLRCT